MRRDHGETTRVLIRIERDPEIQALLMRQARIERGAAVALAWTNRIAAAAMAIITAAMAWNCLPALTAWVLS